MSMLTAMMDRLSLTRKFVLVGILIALSTTLLTYLLFRTSQTNISFSQQERLGVDYVTSLPDLLIKAQRVRDLESQVASGNANVHLADAVTDVDHVLSALDAADQRLGNALGVHDDYQTLRKSWNGLRNASPSHDTVVNAGKLVDSVRSLLSTVCDKSNLSLDPDLDSYYLVDSFCTQIPNTISHVGEQRAVVGDALLRNRLDDPARIRLIELRPLSQQSVEAASGDMEKVFSANVSLKPVLGGAMSSLSDATTKVSDAVHEQALSGAFVVDGNRVAENADAAVLGASRFAESTRVALDGLLVARIERLSVGRDIYIGIAITVMATVVVLFIAMFRSIVSQVRTALKVAEAVSSGDLTQEFDVTRNDEMGQLMRALKRMNSALLDIVRNISGSVGVINAAAQEIASGNADLSQRTGEQAASLEETAASMEELTSTVKQNAENAQQASTLTADASDIASKGSAAVGHVVGTMTDISASSSKIAEITGIIEGIAFQTNILALNAAVEAARAGEQGRGFAVVASEVRNLAQRSSSAAKEIKELIAASVQKIRDGSTLADEAGKTMSEVTRSVARVNEIMGEIAAASDEQSRGIEQVHRAITQMDTVTQQNAALVEEASAASQSLEARGRQLNQTVAFFQLDGAPARSVVSDVEVR